jgi:hypothetical protein
MCPKKAPHCFHPDPATKTLLDQAAKTAFKMTRVMANDMSVYCFTPP